MSRAWTPSHGVAGRSPTPSPAHPVRHAAIPGKRALTDAVAPAGSIQRRAMPAPAVSTGSAAPVAGSARPTLETLFGGALRRAPGERGPGAGQTSEGSVHAAADAGVATSASALPHRDAIQRAFGRHDVSSIQAHVGADAAASARAMGAAAYATGDHVVFDGTPDLHTAAHEAAHVVQQRAGVHLKGGVGEVGDPYERHADAVADLVVQGASAESLLDQQAGGATPGRGTPATQRAVQHIIRITPNQFLSGLGVARDEATQVHLDEYLTIAVLDDLNHALSLLNPQKPAEEKTKAMLERWHARLYDPHLSPQDKLNTVDQVVTTVNKILISESSNRDTRYATGPQNGYVNSALPGGSPWWGSDPAMHGQFAQGMGPGVFDYSTVNPGKRGKLPLTQLPWEDAKRLLPRSLINLIFDVRYQLEIDAWGRQPDPVIDERTPDERERKVTTPNDPGTLRSWHQDSHGVLPDMHRDKKLAKQYRENGIPGEEVPRGSRRLHDHYAKTSDSGSGSSTDKNPIARPMGYAEYTGTGSNTEHNTKIVLDYVSKRIYLTLTHYQYWALIKVEHTEGDGEKEPEKGQSKAKNEHGYLFWESNTQDLGQAQGKLDSEFKGGPETILMSPWMEIVMPTGDTLGQPTPKHRARSNDDSLNNNNVGTSGSTGLEEKQDTVVEDEIQDNLIVIEEKIDAHPEITDLQPSREEVARAKEELKLPGTGELVKQGTVTSSRAKQAIHRSGLSREAIKLMAFGALGLFVAILAILIMRLW